MIWWEDLISKLSVIWGGEIFLALVICVMDVRERRKTGSGVGTRSVSLCSSNVVVYVSIYVLFDDANSIVIIMDY